MLPEISTQESVFVIVVSVTGVLRVYGVVAGERVAGYCLFSNELGAGGIRMLVVRAEQGHQEVLAKGEAKGRLLSFGIFTH